MCVVSQIMDYGRQVFPQQPHQWTYTSPNTSPGQPWTIPGTPPGQKSFPIPPAQPPTLPTPEEMKAWIEAFRALVAAGEEFDRVTGQPDCVDPEKEALMGRVAELEERLKALEEERLDKAE